LGKHKKSIIIHVIEVIIPIFFVVLFIAPFFIPNESKLWSLDRSFNHGFRDRIRSKADIPAIRDWIKTLNKKTEKGFEVDIPYEEWPESLRALRPDFSPVHLGADKNGNPQIRITWGAAIFHWGVIIGMEDMEIAPSDFKSWAEDWLLVEPGVYVYTF
jgi:hypothetical protein